MTSFCVSKLRQSLDALGELLPEWIVGKMWEPMWIVWYWYELVLYLLNHLCLEGDLGLEIGQGHTNHPQEHQPPYVHSESKEQEPPLLSVDSTRQHWAFRIRRYLENTEDIDYNLKGDFDMFTI